MAAPANVSRFSQTITNVQIDGLVVLKVIKHCKEEDAGGTELVQVVLKVIKHCKEEGAGGTELVQGVLLGLVVDNRLEITNCFPFPKHNEEEEFDEVSYQMEMMRHLRHVNVDHLHVGWYQSTYFGSFINKTLLQSQFNYQDNIQESVVLIYDPLRTTQGYLSLKAYRLTPAMMDYVRDGKYTGEKLRQLKLGFSTMFEEIPVHIKNSHLINALLCEVEESSIGSDDYSFLDLATSSVLEKNVRQLMECVDEIGQDTNKYWNYQRLCHKQVYLKNQALAKLIEENQRREQNGEPIKPEEEVHKMFKQPDPPPRLDSLLTAGQIDNYCRQISEFSAQSLGKLFMADGIHGGSQSSS